MTTDEEYLFAAFEDLLEEEQIERRPSSSSTGKNDGGASADDDLNGDDEEGMLHKIDADALTPNDLVLAMERRGLRPRGFFDEDARTLQAVLDREHETYVAEKRRERREAREQEERRAAAHRRRRVMESQLEEERAELAGGDARVRRRIEGLMAVKEHGDGSSRDLSSLGGDVHCRIDVNDVSARSLAKALWNTNAIVSLDVSNMGLSDLAGAFLSRSLRNNKSLIKLELGENKFAVKTGLALGDALRINQTLKHLGLDSNPLSGKNDLSGIQVISSMITQNSSLTYISMWRCKIGPEGGKMIAEAISVNHALTGFELGYNSWDAGDVRRIFNKLQENIGKSNRQIEMEQEKRQERERQDERDAIVAITERKEKEVAEWFEEQKQARSEERILEMEKMEIQRKLEEERLIKEAERRRQKESEAAEEAKKKKKKKKATKKKKGKKRT